MIKSGQSQFATLKLRSLALVPSSGALTRPCELHLWQLHCKTLPFGLTPLQFSPTEKLPESEFDLS